MGGPPGSSKITQAVPVFHNEFLPTVMEMSLLHLEESLEGNDKLSILGVYFANEMVTDQSLSAAAIIVADRIKQNGAGDSVLVQLADITENKPDLRWFEGEKSNFKKQKYTLEPGTEDKLREALLREEERHVVDFEEWLQEGCSAVWPRLST